MTDITPQDILDDAKLSPAIADTVTIPRAEYEQMKVEAEYIKRLEETLEYLRNTLLGKGIASDTVILGRMSIAKYKCENLIMQALTSRPAKKEKEHD